VVVVADYFRGAVLDKINLAGLDRVMVLTAHGDKVYFRHYAISLKKSGTKVNGCSQQLHLDTQKMT